MAVKMPDAELVVTGKPLFYTVRPTYDEATRQPIPGKPNGTDVSILGVQGLAILRFTQDEVVNGALPAIGREGAWVVTATSWAQGQGASNVVLKHVRVASSNDLDTIHRSLKAAAAA